MKRTWCHVNASTNLAKNRCFYVWEGAVTVNGVISSVFTKNLSIRSLLACNLRKIFVKYSEWTNLRKFQCKKQVSCILLQSYICPIYLFTTNLHRETCKREFASCIERESNVSCCFFLQTCAYIRKNAPFITCFRFWWMLRVESVAMINYFTSKTNERRQIMYQLPQFLSKSTTQYHFN